MKKQNIVVAILLLLSFEPFHSIAQNAPELYVGTNYHPHDSNLEQWKKDIQLMKAAGFTVVRMGHLAWDSYEQTEGKFDFAWFDQVMDMMNKAGIKVILDIAVRPAPLWLHHKYPSINITDPSGNNLYPNHRYMEDMGDPLFQKYALRYADTLTKHYAHNPALLAFGIDNEPGDGAISYSETVKNRFIDWLKAKYTTNDALNKAWAGQRWSRRINKFEEVGLPMSGSMTGPPERVLDFRRFISDEVTGFLLKVIDKANVNAPNVLNTSNMWFTNEKKYFDYPEIAYSGKMKRGGEGFYPGKSLLSNVGIDIALFGMAQIQFENTTPFWNIEFTSMGAVPNSVRKSAYATLLYGNQMICGWTWQSMSAGEEQHIQGMMDWDGLTNRSYDEYKQIATEFKKIGKYGFPYKNEAEIGLGYSFSSQIASYLLPQTHDQQLKKCWDLFVPLNMDTRLVDIKRSDLKYKLLILPGTAVMDEHDAAKIREYVNNGGTVVMTSGSAVFDEHNQIFTTTQPGRLSDVFGIRIANHEETLPFNEISREGLSGNNLHIKYKNSDINSSSPRFDVVESKGADVLGKIVSLDKDYPIITSNKYGKGKAIYVGLPASQELLDPIIGELISELAIKKGLDVPKDVMARNIDAHHILYLNIGKLPITINMKGKLKSVLSDKEYVDSFTIQPNEPEFIEHQ